MTHQLSACEIHRDFVEGKKSAVSIVQTFLKRIDQYEPQIQAFLSVYKKQAIEKAKTLDSKKQAGKKIGKLAAIPIAIKDNILIKKEISTCGSKFLLNYRSFYNASVVSLLEQEDAIIIGKTNLDEFGMGSSTEHSSFKVTRNPWNLSCVPGGSSGGSAAAVAARLCPVALGSDTGGSIRQPAAFCGIYGFKPTYGRVSRYGLVAFGSSLDQIGPMATCAADIALVMEVIGKHCPKDSTSLPHPAENYLNSFDDVDLSLENIRIGVPWKFLKDLPSELRKNFEDTLEKFKHLGASICKIDLDILDYSLAIYYILSTAEASTNLARFDGIRYGQRSKQAKTLDEVYTFSKEEGFGPEVKRRILLGTYVLSSGYKDAYYKKAQKVRTLIIENYRQAFNTCQFIAMPSTPFPAFELGSIQDPLQMYLSDIYTISANLAGLPAMALPSGKTQNNKPLGIQLIAPQKQDVALYHISHKFDKAYSFGKEIPPNYI